MKTAGFSKSWIVFFCFLITLLCFVLAVTTRVHVSEKKEYYSAEQVALYLYAYKHLPSNFLTKESAKELFGQEYLCIEEGYNIGGDVFSAAKREDYRDWIGNYSDKTSFFECDIYPDREKCISHCPPRVFVRLYGSLFHGQPLRAVRNPWVCLLQPIFPERFEQFFLDRVRRCVFRAGGVCA